jgi:hypothetical protein
MEGVKCLTILRNTGNDPLNPDNKKPQYILLLRGHFGEKTNFLSFLTNNLLFLDCPASRLVNLCLRTEVTKEYDLIYFYDFEPDNVVTTET